MNITVYNDGELVHTGTLDEFLGDNGNDEWLTEQCARLETSERIEFDDFHSGNWVVERIDDGVSERDYQDYLNEEAEYNNIGDRLCANCERIIPVTHGELCDDCATGRTDRY
jgi:hypothetical protein